MSKYTESRYNKFSNKSMDAYTVAWKKMDRMFLLNNSSDTQHKILDTETFHNFAAEIFISETETDKPETETDKPAILLGV